MMVFVRSRLIALAMAALTAACASIPDAPRMFSLQGEQVAMHASAACPAAPTLSPPAPVAQPVVAALPVTSLRVITWNVHKMDDEGWQADLDRYARGNDLLLLQEAVLTPEVRQVLEGAGMRWQLAGAFAFNGVERGVMLASRVMPSTVCTHRYFEPLTVLPKSTLIARYPLQGRAQQLAVANLHGINFSLGMGAFSEQLDAVADELANHDGPIIVGGDINTWSESRMQRLADVARRLQLQPVTPSPDQRRRVFGHALDHLLVRGLVPLEANAPVVRSSDHNPILTRLEVR